MGVKKTTKEEIFRATYENAMDAINTLKVIYHSKCRMNLFFTIAMLYYKLLTTNLRLYHHIKAVIISILTVNTMDIALFFSIFFSRNAMPIG